MKSSTRFSKRSVNHVTTLGLGLLALIAAGPALAATATSNLGVSATVASTCLITTTAVAFGTYNSVTNLSTPLDNTAGAVNVTCTSGSALEINLGSGVTPAAGTAPAIPLRQMASGDNRLPYFLYSDSLGGTVWGDTIGTGKTTTGTGVTQNLQIFARIPAAQNVPAGSYADTVLATVTFP